MVYISIFSIAAIIRNGGTKIPKERHAKKASGKKIICGLRKRKRKGRHAIVAAHTVVL